jgi:hypothetical protein
MITKTNIAPLFVNYDIKNKRINYTERLYMAGFQSTWNSIEKFTGFTALKVSMYSYCCLCILIIHPCILIVVYVHLLLSMYYYCSSMYS